MVREAVFINSQSYYRIWNNRDCNIESAERSIIVNCTGCCVLPMPFVTHNRTGRKDYYLLYMYKGVMSVMTDEGMKDIRAGQFVTFYPGREYKYAGAGTGAGAGIRAVAGTETRDGAGVIAGTRDDAGAGNVIGADEIIYFWVHFTGSAAKELMESCGMGDRKIADAGVNESIIHEFNMLFVEFIRREKYYETAAAAIISSICAGLARSVARKTADNAAMNPDKIFASLKYIHSNYNSTVDIRQMAEADHLSASRYRAVFKKYTGLSPRNYVIELRIKRACELIIQTDLTFKEIANAVGWPDQLYFSRIFRERIGYTPGAYRAQAGQL